MGQLGFAETFACVHSAQDEEYGKPHLGVYLTAARKLVIGPAECLAVEDSLNGVLAAEAARMSCVAVPELAQRNDPRFTIADHTLGSRADVNEELWSRLGVA